METRHSDEDIIRLMLTDKRQYDACFHELYKRHSKWVFNKALQFVPEGEAEDVLQEVFIKVCINLSKFKFGSKFSTWLFSITYNTCVNAVNKRNKTISREVEFAEFSYENDQYDEQDIDEIIHEISVDRLRIIMNIIDPEEKKILLMKYQDDLSIKELADMLSLSEGAVKMRLLRAKEKLRSLYEKKFNYV